jgi:hypothetical protein
MILAELVYVAGAGWCRMVSVEMSPLCPMWSLILQKPGSGLPETPLVGTDLPCHNYYPPDPYLSLFLTFLSPGSLTSLHLGLHLSWWCELSICFLASFYVLSVLSRWRDELSVMVGARALASWGPIRGWQRETILASSGPGSGFREGSCDV